MFESGKAKGKRKKEGVFFFFSLQKGQMFSARRSIMPEALVGFEKSKRLHGREK